MLSNNLQQLSLGQPTYWPYKKNEKPILFNKNTNLNTTSNKLVYQLIITILL